MVEKNSIFFLQCRNYSNLYIACNFVLKTVRDQIRLEIIFTFINKTFGKKVDTCMINQKKIVTNGLISNPEVKVDGGHHDMNDREIDNDDYIQ